jgi:hypothetical protein
LSEAILVTIIAPLHNDPARQMASLC